MTPADVEQLLENQRTAKAKHAAIAQETRQGFRALELLRPVMLVLPYPPSVNRLYRVGRNGRPYKTDLHRDYMASAQRATRAVTPWPRDVALEVTLRLYRPQKRGDIDNPLKALFDALNGRAWEDDSQVSDLHVQRRDDKANPRVEVEIKQATP